VPAVAVPSKTLPQKYVGDPSLVVDEARSDRDVLRIRREVAGREWATRHRIPTAETVALDPDGRWLVSRRAADEPGEPWPYVLAAFDVARQIQDLPCPSFVTTAATWRAPRRTVALRAARMLRGGIDLRAFVAARTAFDELPRDATVHNDYHRSNVLSSGSPHGVTVIDWELTSLGPRHQDLVMLLVDIVDPEVAHAAWRVLVDSVPATEHAALATQLRWLTLRTYASEITTPQIPSNPAKTERRRLRWVQAQDWAAELAADHREVS
jgi:hypothetical protein